MIKNEGFTLIEMVLYLALFSILMSGLVAAFWGLSVSSQSTLAKTRSQEELNFVLKKIDWALAEGATLRFSSTNHTAEICTEVCGTEKNFLPLTSKNVKVEKFSITSFPDRTQIDIELDGISITTNKYKHE